MHFEQHNTNQKLLVLRQKVVGRPKNQPKSVPTSADKRPTSTDFPKFCSPTFARLSVLGNPTVALRTKKSTGVTK